MEQDQKTKHTLAPAFCFLKCLWKFRRGSLVPELISFHNCLVILGLGDDKRLCPKVSLAYIHKGKKKRIRGVFSFFNPLFVFICRDNWLHLLTFLNLFNSFLGNSSPLGYTCALHPSYYYSKIFLSLSHPLFFLFTS